MHLFDDAGNQYLDLLSGIGVSALGYGHPAITKAITAQAATLLHTSNLFYHDGTATLAVKLTEMTGMDRVFFCNSGTEAWEAALKLARAYAGVLRAEGKTIGTRFHRHGARLPRPHHGLRRDDAQAEVSRAVCARDAGRDLRSLQRCRCAARCVQRRCVRHLHSNAAAGRGRHSSRLAGVLRSRARAVRLSTGALLLCDEIQSGMGRTGRWTAYQHYGIQPDVTTLAKPLAGGLPMGATLCTEDVARAITPGMHGTTFGGGPLVCAVAIAVIDEIERTNLLAHVSEVGAYFVEKLRGLAKEHDSIVEVRGTGFMIGVEMQTAELAKEIADRMMFERHIILSRTSDTVLRFLPPFLITKAHIDETMAALGGLLQDASAAQIVLAGEQVHG